MLAPAVRTPIAIALGAIAGALSRYYLGLWLNHWLGAAPYSTLIINLTGCFGMGLLVAIFLHLNTRIHPDVRILLTTGFLGSYTTFSSYVLDTATLLQQQQVVSALLYWVGSAGLGLVSLYLGMALAQGVLQHLSSE